MKRQREDVLQLKIAKVENIKIINVFVKLKVQSAL